MHTIKSEQAMKKEKKTFFFMIMSLLYIFYHKWPSGFCKMSSCFIVSSSTEEKKLLPGIYVIHLLPINPAVELDSCWHI